MELLIEAGADLNAHCSFGPTALTHAIFHGSMDCLKLLIEAGADPNIPDKAAASVDERIAAWKSQGREAYAKEDYRTAISFYGKVLDIHPTDAAMYANQSICWLRMRHGDKALEVARKCRKMQPRWPKAWYREGMALSFMKDYEGAADAFREALQLDPNNEEIKEELRKAEKAVEDPQRVGKISKG
ncbi:small glutamine-rich tetratricopeptide repeat-containing protein 2-like isoform X2 [Lolium perenne]|uniref:small glutamine-rich tetratricopeptide repeat-containing protein 2-like isoform X2 n=1 Tax=Lolium perenne TaxID=4522 RepID=UPI003A98ED5D